MRPGKLALLSSVLILSLTVRGAASDTKSVPQSPPKSDLRAAQTLQMYSRETIVDVIVTDSNGQPIQGLKDSDFTIKEDGKPQPLRSFREFGAGTDDHAHVLPKLPAHVHTNYQSSPATGPVNILLIDAMHSNPLLVSRALRATSVYLTRMPQGTQLAIFWLGSGGLHMLQGFTSDPSVLLEALSTNRTDIGSEEDAHTTDWYTIDALQQIAAYASAIKGRKNLIWFTPGMPVHLTRDGGYGWGSSVSPHIPGSVRADSFASNATTDFWDARQGDPWNIQSVFGDAGLNMGMVHRLMDTYEIFTAEQIAVSPIDPSGVGGAMGSSQLSAVEVAEQSGGIAHFNSNDLTSLVAEAINDGSHFYTLSYVPPRRKQDGHYHTIDVKVNLPGAHLVYRKGYNAEDPKPPLQFAGADLIQASLQGKAPPATQLLFDAKFEPAPGLATAPATPTLKRRDKLAGRTAYDLVIAVPQSQINFADGPNGTRSAALQFAFDAYDSNGRFLGRHSQNVDLALTPERYEEFVKTPLLFHEQIALFPGPLFLRVGVLDSISNKVGTLEIPVTVPKK